MKIHSSWIAAPGSHGPQAHSQFNWLGRAFACTLFVTSSCIAAENTAPPITGDPLDHYLLAIEEAETLGGPYAIELQDLYFGFGQVLLEDGDLKAALNAFQRTAMIARVNSGPNSLDQTNYLYKVARTESLLGDLEPAIRVIEYIYQIHAREYGENNSAMLPVVEQMLQWYEEEKPLGTLPSRSTDLQNQSFLMGRIADLTAEQYGLGSSEAALSYRSQGQMHFRTIFYLFRTGEPPKPQLVINNGGSANPWVVERSISNHYRAGEAAYERAVESWKHNPDADALHVAEAIAQLGDWYLVLEQSRSARREYERAYQLLVASIGNADLADEYFGTPAPLKLLDKDGNFLRDLDAPVNDEGLQVSMTVARDGRILDIEIQNVKEEGNQENIQTITRRLQRTRFRPAVMMGEVVKSEGFVWSPPPVVPKIAATAEDL